MKRFFTMIISLCTLGCAQAFNWYTTDRPVIYHIVGKTAPVVEIALQLFRSDIKDVTDKEAVPGKNACIEIYELDKASSSTVNSLKTLGVPTDNVQKDLDGFYLGVKKGKIIIAGNNGRGTAYGILELSRKAGVSPWVWWGDVKPQKQSQLTLPDNFETYQTPR